MYGSASYAGGSAGAGLYLGVDMVSFEDASDPDGDLDGIQITLGYGAGVDVHIIETETKPLRIRPRKD